MVVLTKILLYAKPRKVLRNYRKTGFLDSIRIYVRGGSGGCGLPKFGGVGGQGGDVSVVAKESISLQTVLSIYPRRRISAKHGANSTHNFILGLPGESVKLDVPIGVTVIKDDGTTIGELNQEGEELIVARGGTGGHPKNGYIGKQGQALSVRLDLKLIADIGLVGFPNAGKSTLLKAVSQAKPKIASYPFTTVKPNVGTVVYNDFRQIMMADLPGLIEGAHINKGMGHKFLKHVERTKLLLLVVDINGFQLSPQYPHRSCLDTIVLLNKELEMYNKDLLQKPAMIIINKMDLEGAHEKYDAIKYKISHLADVVSEYPEDARPDTALEFVDIMAVSAKEGGEIIELVKRRLRRILDINAEEAQDQDEKSAKVMRTLKDSMIERGPRLV